MTPYEIAILFWYYARPNDHPDLEANPPVWGRTILDFKAKNLLISAAAGTGSCYVLTERGRVYCDALRKVPLPVQEWVMPHEP